MCSPVLSGVAYNHLLSSQLVTEDHITGSLSSNQLDPKKEKETLVFLGVCVPGPIEVVSCHSVNSGEPLG